MNKNDSATISLNRRNFLRNAGTALGAAGLASVTSACHTTSSECDAPSGRAMAAKNDVILFQGDSITDMSRKRTAEATPNNEPALGTGYAAMAAMELLVERPGDGLKIYNRGISGNKVYQLSDRWQADCLDLKPNLLSILIGVNDLWHTLTGQYQGTLEIYERDYRALLQRTMQALPNLKLVICEPFVLRCGAVNDTWFPQFDQYRAAAKRVADSYHATFVPFQTMFDEALKYSAPEHLAKDGVHPTPLGASLMAHQWLSAVVG
jgi:lysophospholipase L1-like esterase